MTNVVKPKITPDATDVWFDPTGRTKLAVKTLFSMAQSDTGTYPYKGGGTIVRNKPNIVLFRDKDCKTPIVFSENKARVSNEELLKDNGSSVIGLVAYVAGTESSVSVATQLKLELDFIEKSERKLSIDPVTKAPANITTINVDNTAAGSAVDLTVKTSGVATPFMVIGTIDDADVRVSAASPTPLTFGIKEKVGESGTTYDGDGELTIPGGGLLLFTDRDCKNPVTISGGKAKIANNALRSEQLFWLKAADDAAESSVRLTLALGPASDPTKFVVDGSTTKVVELVLINTVKPVLALTIPGAHDGTVWYPPLAGKPASIKLSATQTQAQSWPYRGDGLLERSAAGLEVFRDEALTQPMPFYDDALVIANAELVGSSPLELFLRGTATGDVDLTLSLYDPKQRVIAVDKAAKATVPVKPINLVTSEIDHEGLVATEGASATKITVRQSNAGVFAYEKDGTLVRPSEALQVFTRLDSGKGRDPLFGGSNLEVTIGNGDLLDQGKVYYTTWQGKNPPDAVTTAALELRLPRSSKPYVVTEPASQLLAEPKLKPVIEVVGGTTITPKIETEYDLVLRSTIDPDADPKRATTPVRARFFATSSTPTVPYGGDGTLTRSNDKIAVYLDPKCTLALNFSTDNKATIPNAQLLDDERVYYLVGVGKGACKLELTAAKPADGTPKPVGITVADPASKDLAVVALELEVFRDDGLASPPTANTVKLTTIEKRYRGRAVHVQSGSLYGRAKVVVKTVDTSDWPVSARNHQIRLAIAAAGDKLELFTGDTGGSAVGTYTTPITIDKSTAGSGDNTYYAEGKAASDVRNDLVLDLGISRTDGSGWDATEPLRHGDWASFTSVKITGVKPDASDWRQYVNQPPDRTRKSNTNDDKDKTGRNIQVTAQLAPARSGIGVDFMLWGFDGNGDATGTAPRVPLIPDELKAEEKHVTSVSDDSGQASARIKLSRYGGDKFHAVAFLADDAAKGVSELGKKGNTAPDNTKSKPIEVWQKIFYTLAAMQRHGGGDYRDRADAPSFQATFEPAFIEMALPSGAVVATPAHQALLTKGNAAGGWWTTSGLPAPAERTVNVALLDMISRDGDPPVDVEWTITALGSVTPSMDIVGNYDLTDWLVAGSGLLYKKSTMTAIVAIDDGRFTLSYSGQAKFKLEADITGLLGGNPLGDLGVFVQLKYHNGPSGFTSGTKTFVGIRTREQSDPVTATASCVHTMGHEVGHYLGLTAEKVPDPTQTLNRYWYEGIGAQTNYNTYNVGTSAVEQNTDLTAIIGLGDHCKYDSPNYDTANLKGGKLPDGSSPQCIMYHQLTAPVTTTYCSTCVKALRARDLSVPPVSGGNDF